MHISRTVYKQKQSNTVKNKSVSNKYVKKMSNMDFDVRWQQEDGLFH